MFFKTLYLVKSTLNNGITLKFYMHSHGVHTLCVVLCSSDIARWMIVFFSSRVTTVKSMPPSTDIPNLQPPFSSLFNVVSIGITVTKQELLR